MKNNKNNLEENSLLIKDISSFKTLECLTNTTTKCAYRGTINEKEIVITIKPKELDADTLSSIIAISSYKLSLENNDYHYYDLSPPTMFPSYTACIITNPTPQIIKRATDKPKVFIRETKDLYNKVTLPFINSFPNSDNDWIKDLLHSNGDLKGEKILYKDTEFIITQSPDFDTSNLSSFKLLVLTYNEKLRSIRDLRGEHIPLLKSMKNKVEEIVDKKYHINKNQLRFYIHYFPSFWYFHIHISIYSCLEGHDVDRAHLLDDVIDHLEKDSLNYINRSFTICLTNDDPLVQKYQNC